MLRIRFSRVGKKNSPSFRLVLTPQTSPPKGRFLEILGFYNPRTKEKGVQKERVLHWISQGAQPSDTAHNFLIREGVIEGKKVSVHSTAKRKKAETAEKAPAAEEAPTEPAESPEDNQAGEGLGGEAPTKEVPDDKQEEESTTEEASAEESSGKDVPEATSAEKPIDNN